MSFLDLAKKRCSTRAYQPVPVSQEHIDAIVEAARVAPTAAYQLFAASRTVAQRLGFLYLDYERKVTAYVGLAGAVFSA